RLLLLRVDPDLLTWLRPGFALAPDETQRERLVDPLLQFDQADDAGLHDLGLHTSLDADPLPPDLAERNVGRKRPQRDQIEQMRESDAFGFARLDPLDHTAGPDVGDINRPREGHCLAHAAASSAA